MTSVTTTANGKVIDMTGYFHSRRRNRRQDALHRVLALWTQYMAVAALALYGLLRMTFFRQAAIGTYSGPLALLWPISFVLLLASYVFDLLLWREE